MKKAVWWLSVLTVMMTGTVTANDLYTYRYVNSDGTIVNVTDAGYTKVGNVTVAGKTYWGAFSAVPKSQDTSIIKVATNIPLPKHGNFTVTKRMPDPEYPGGRIMEMEEEIPRSLYGWEKSPHIWGTIDGTAFSIPKTPGTMVLLNNAIHIEPTDRDTNVDLAKTCLRNGEAHGKVPAVTESAAWWTHYTSAHIQNVRVVGTERLLWERDAAGKWKTAVKHTMFEKETQLRVWTIGHNRMGRDKSVNSMYFFYGQEAGRYFRTSVLDERIRMITNPNGFHVANAKTDMFGAGFRKTKPFAHGLYGEVLGQYAVFDRQIHTVNDGVYGSQKASVQGSDVGLSVEAGRHIAVMSHVFLQPEVQYTYHLYDQHVYTDSLQRKFGRIYRHEEDIRVGLQVAYKGIYAKVNRYFSWYNQHRLPAVTEYEIGVARHFHRNGELGAAVSSRTQVLWRSRKSGKTYKKRQQTYRFWAQFHF